MEASSLLKSNVTQELISTVIRSMLFTTYADIVEVQDDFVVVQGCVCENTMFFTTEAKIVYPTTSAVQVKFKPSVGDKVLVVGLQSYSDDMFLSDEPILDVPENNVQHYTILGCIAIPLNIESETQSLRISDGDFKIEGSDKHGITINEGEDPVVRWSELKTVLTNLQNIFNSHTHQLLGVTIAGTANQTGSFTGGITGDTTTGRVPGTLWNDTFTDLASDVLAVPGGGTT